MNTVLHICAGWQPWNGAANIARKIMDEQRCEGHEVSFATWTKVCELRAANEVWIHCGWLPCLWWAALWGRNVRWMPEACYDPVRLKFHGWKKWLVGPIERFFLRRCDRIVATCEAEKGWIERYLGKKCPGVEVTDIKRFFDLPNSEVGALSNDRPLHLLYLGRRHPLKGLVYLEEALRELQKKDVSVNFRVVSNAFGEEKELVWNWCDVLILPTLSDNFGLVIAEALERGKRVITTDGAPVWGDGNDYGGRLTYLRGYRDGLPEERVRLLKCAIAALVSIASAIKGFYLHQGGTGSVPSILCGRDGARPSQ